LNLNQREARGALGTALNTHGDYLFPMKWKNSDAAAPGVYHDKATHDYMKNDKMKNNIDMTNNIAIKEPTIWQNILFCFVIL
jgi:hypothetical protein